MDFLLSCQRNEEKLRDSSWLRRCRLKLTLLDLSFINI